jgi:hypothetical protein
VVDEAVQHGIGDRRIGEQLVKLTRLRGAHQAFAGGVLDVAYPPALFAGVSAPNG